MQSTLNPQQADPHADPHDDVLVARIDEELSKLAHDAMRDPLDPQTHMGSDFPAGPAVPPVDTTFRPAAVNQGLRPSFGMRAIRTFVGFLLAVCIGVAGVVWQAYGDAAKQMIARWTPQLIATSSPPPENPGLPEQPNPPAVQANAAKAAPPQPAPPAQAAPEGVAPAAAAPESAVLLESMARELASARQEIDQLKASQEQMSRELAKSSPAKASLAKASQIKASQTKASEQNLRPRISALPPRPVAAPVRRPMPPSYPPPQAAAAPVLPQAPAPYVPRQPEAPPQVTAQPQAEPELSPVPRPPMPVLR